VILVTGSTGNVGSAVVAALTARGVPFRVGVREAPLASAGGTAPSAVPLNLLDRTTFAPAVAGCDALFLLRPPAIANTKETLVPFIDVAREAGVRQVVFVSVAGAASNPIVPHHAVEQHLQRGPMEWTILRPGFFAQNFGDAYRRDIVEDHRVYVPAGAGRVAFVDVRDMAEVAVAALVDPASHAGHAYTLTGQRAITFGEAARILSEALGRHIDYTPASIPGYVMHLRRRGLPLAQVVVQTILHAGLRFDQAAVPDDSLRQLLQRPPRTFAEYVHDHRGLWT
jgi:uncharacterized protein YbjT (DUF2867 family)